MEIIAKISKGSKMDQVYIPRNRSGFSTGSYVVLKPLETKKITEKPYLYNIKHIEPIKLQIINEVFETIDKNVNEYENIIITGSFIDKGFNFNDIDIILVSEGKINIHDIKNIIEQKTGIKTHIILLDNKTLIQGLSTDPLYQMMLSRCIVKKRFIYKIKPKINYKILDIHLLKSKTLMDGFDLLDGNEKYYLTRNMVAIHLFLKNKKVSNELVDREIIRLFELKEINEIKQNMLDKNEFLRKYKSFYERTFNEIMRNIKNDAK